MLGPNIELRGLQYIHKLLIQIYGNYLMDKYNFLNDNSNDKTKS